MTTQKNDYTELWQNPDNWRLYGFYVCREDPRLIVPKRLRLTGWTLNFAHRQAYQLFVALLAVIIVPNLVVDALNLGTMSWVRSVTIILSILAAVVLTWWASRLRVE